MVNPEFNINQFETAEEQNAYMTGWLAGSREFVEAQARALVRIDTLRQLAEQRQTIDGLTGLPNRQGLVEAYTRLQATAARYSAQNNSILMIDTDKFKDVNDTYGHAEGDKLLQTISRILTEGTRPEDTVGRLGGDEFLALLPNTSIENAARVAKRLCLQMEEVHIGDVRPTFSIGVSTINPLAEFDAMFVEADRAMYDAKENGRNQVWIATNGTSFKV